MRSRTIPLLFVMALGSTCRSEPDGRPETGLETLALRSVDPGTVLPGSTMVLEGDAFIDAPLGISWLRLSGTYAGSPVDVQIGAKFVDFDRLEVEVDTGVLAQLGSPEGVFEGEASVIVDFTPDGSQHHSRPLSVTLDVRRELTPTIEDTQFTAAIHVNDPIPVTGDGFLLGTQEGTTRAVVEGCFTREDETECIPVGPTAVDLIPDDPFDRTRGTFAFSPSIAGIHPGHFEGRFHLRNDHQDGTQTKSDAVLVDYAMAATTITGIGPGGSMGEYVDVEGAGFVGDDEGLTLLRISGQYVGNDAVGGTPVEELELVPEFASGRLVRYVINEDDSLGLALAPLGGVRYAAGAFDGFVQAVVVFEGEELVGPALPMTFRIDPVKQVIWVRFMPSYVESLRKFGLRAMDSRIRDRVMEVLERDYESLNVEFRTEEPTDFKLYSIVEIAGPDPNGLGLLGYDNSHGKDVNNERLHDRIGGVNALTQEDGFPGFGGVFMDSLFIFSHHPPEGARNPDVANALFDQIFDPVRPDRGTPVSSKDLTDGDIPVLTTAGGCPTGDRRLQIACAVWVLGSVVGTTTSHEIGHSLGLADPYGSRFHNLGDGPNRLMDQGGNRPFEERAELMGQGPGLFCNRAYDYLREILPTSLPPTDYDRPSC
jgi:hypothetical protein